MLLLFLLQFLICTGFGGGCAYLFARQAYMLMHNLTGISWLKLGGGQKSSSSSSTSSQSAIQGRVRKPVFGAQRQRSAENGGSNGGNGAAAAAAGAGAGVSGGLLSSDDASAAAAIDVEMGRSREGGGAAEATLVSGLRAALQLPATATTTAGDAVTTEVPDATAAEGKRSAAAASTPNTVATAESEGDTVTSNPYDSGDAVGNCYYLLSYATGLDAYAQYRERVRQGVAVSRVREVLKLLVWSATPSLELALQDLTHWLAVRRARESG